VRLYSVGPSSAIETIQKGLAMGAHEAVHLRTEPSADPDSRAIAEVLAEQLRSDMFDLVLCGKQAQDTDAGLTGGMLASLLNLPWITNAVDVSVENDRLFVSRQGDEGRERYQLMLPCLVTCSNDMNEPRIPSLRGIVAARGKPVTVLDVVAPQARVKITDVSVPVRPPRGTILEGSSEEAVEALCEALLSDGIL
jgi:electron transfer flavoprotein beta subunit